jgi:uncharacterized protein (DUF1330 family)
MKTPLLFAAFTTLAVGGLGVAALNAQAPSAPKRQAFYISEFEVTDPDALRAYSARVTPTFEPFGGRYVVRGGNIAPLEGEAPRGRIVMIAFDSVEKAQAWYNSPAYQEIMPIRHGAAKSRVFIVEGMAN